MEGKRPASRRWILSRHRALLWPMIALVTMSAILSAIAVVFAFISKLTIDAAQFREGRIFVTAAIALAGLLALQLCVRALHNYVLARTEAHAARNLRAHLYGEILRKKPRAIERIHSGEWMNYLQSDVRAVSYGVAHILPKFVFLVLRFVFAFILLFYLDRVFAFVMLGFGSLLFIASLFVRNAIKRRHNRMQDAEAHLRSYMQEGLEHLPLIKSFEAEQFTEMHMRKRQGGFVRALLAKKRLSIAAGTALQGFFSAAYAFAIIFGAYQIGMNVLTFGSLVAILQLVEFMQSPFVGLSTLLPQFYAMSASSERLMRVEAFPPEAKTRYTPIDGFSRIIFDNITFKYDDAEILSSLNIEIDRHDFVHIKGDSGIGKTTFLKLLLGLLEPDAGEIRIETETATLTCSADTRSLFTYVPQGLMIQSGTIAENIAYNRKDADKTSIRAAAEAACILDDIEALPQGFDTVISERGGGLSEGQVQRLAIARALMRDAEVLLLDEITSALDQKTEKAILANIRTMREKTCLVISHRDIDGDLVDLTIEL